MKDMPLFTVFVVACTCMMSVLIVGTYVDAIFPKVRKVQHVPCSVTIQDMASKYKVKLLNECEVEV
jgi:hypothetical protein